MELHLFFNSHTIKITTSFQIIFTCAKSVIPGTHARIGPESAQRWRPDASSGALWYWVFMLLQHHRVTVTSTRQPKLVFIPGLPWLPTAAQQMTPGSSWETPGWCCWTFLRLKKGHAKIQSNLLKTLWVFGIVIFLQNIHKRHYTFPRRARFGVSFVSSSLTFITHFSL